MPLLRLGSNLPRHGNFLRIRHAMPETSTAPSEHIFCVTNTSQIQRQAVVGSRQLDSTHVYPETREGKRSSLLLHTSRRHESLSASSICELKTGLCSISVIALKYICELSRSALSLQENRWRMHTAMATIGILCVLHYGFVCLFQWTDHRRKRHR